MKQFYLLALAGMLSAFQLNSQTLSAPDPQGVFGGRVLAIAQADDGVSPTRIYFATESANSLFYADVNYSGGRPVFDSVHPVPSADWDDGYGSNIQQVQAFHTTMEVFFLAMGTVYKTDPSATSATMVQGMVKNFIIEGNTYLAVLNGAMPSSNDSLVWGSISTSGTLTISGGLDLTRQFNGPPQMVVDPTTMYLKLFEPGATPYQLSINQNINSLTPSASITSAVNPAPVDPNIEWMTFGVSPTGAWYVAGGPAFGTPPNTDRKIGISWDNGATWTTGDFNLPGPPGGVPGQNFQFTAVGALQYGVYCGRAYSDSIGAPGSWTEIGRLFTGNNNKANDGHVLIDSRSQSTVYLTTNVGFGVSRYAADSVFGANEGLTAVQVNGIDMTPSFATGYVASKSGIRKVEAFKSGSPMWTDPIFPQGDGSPYFSVAMDPTDSNTVYVGNGRVYKTTNGGVNWNLVFDPMMGGSHGATYNYPRVGTRVTGLAVSPVDHNIVYATYELENIDDGGIFISTDGGATWTQELIVAGSPGKDVDATDVVALDEGGKSVFYVSLKSDPMTSGYSGVYRMEESGSGTRTVTAESAFGATDAVLDLELTDNADTVLALYYTSSTINPPVRVYMKDIATSSWSFVVGPNGPTPTALTSGGGQLFLALNNEIHSHLIDSILGPWNLAYAYPIGTRIESLFYDELLVGTGTGLYAQDFTNNVSVIEVEPTEVVVYPNPAERMIHWDVEDDVTLTNLMGRDLVQLRASAELDVSQLPAGVYILRGEKIGVHRIIVR